MESVSIGVIGGSGLYEMEGLTRVTSVKVTTPFGKTSDDFIIGTLHGRRVAFLPRHGRGHRLLPTDINYRANIYGMKKLGVQRIISVSAVGSMKEKIKPGDIVIPGQFYDHDQTPAEHLFRKRSRGACGHGRTGLRRPGQGPYCMQERR